MFKSSQTAVKCYNYGCYGNKLFFAVDYLAL